MYLKDKAQHYLRRRWSLVREYPLEFFGMPLGAVVTGLVLYVVGLGIVDDLLWRFVLVCSAYVLGLVAIVNTIINLLFIHPDRYRS